MLAKQVVFKKYNYLKIKPFLFPEKFNTPRKKCKIESKYISFANRFTFFLIHNYIIQKIIN